MSACLLGRPVRYDGEHQHEPIVVDVLARHLNLRELCPEVGIGLPVPRPPIHIIQIGEQRRVRGVEAPHQDVTDALQQFGHDTDDHFCGFILKARSPSCGVGTTPLLDQRGEVIDTTDGEFSRILRQRFPCTPLTDETALQTENAIDNFLLRVLLYRQWSTQSDLTSVYTWRQQLQPMNETLTPATHAWLETLAAHSQ